MEGTAKIIDASFTILSAAGSVSRGAANVVECIAPFVPLINTVTGVVQDIISMYQEAEHNKRICSALFDRAALAEAAVRSLQLKARDYETELQSPEFYQNFKKFVETIKKIRDFVKDIYQLSGLKKFLMSHDIADRFNELSQEFDGQIRVLNFALAVQTQKETEAIAADMKELKVFMENIHAGITTQAGNKFNPDLEAIEDMSKAHLSSHYNSDELFGTVMIPPSLIKEPEENDRVQIDKVQKAYYTPPETGIPVEVALKSQAIGTGDETRSKELISQVIIYKRFKLNENIIKFYGLVSLDNGLHLVTEWADLGTLKEAYTADPDAFTWNIKTSIAIDVLRALTFLHSISIYHHDIRSANVLITDRYAAKIQNFSYGRTFYGPTSSMENTLEKARYMAPEKINNPRLSYNMKCEIYSFGMLLWEIAQLKEPYHEITDFLQVSEIVANNTGKVVFGETVPPEWKKATLAATSFSPGMRPRLSELFTIFFNLAKKLKPTASPRLSSQSSHRNSSTGSELFVTNTIADPIACIDDDFELDGLAKIAQVMSIEDAIKQHKITGGDRAKAFEAFKVHAEWEDMTAKYYYGYYLHYNLVPTPDETGEQKEERLKKAAELFKETADKGMADAQLIYGHCLWNCTGVKGNKLEAVKYFELAAEQKNITALYNIGKLYYQGSLPGRGDKAKGEQYLKSAALNGHDKAKEFCAKNNILITFADN